VRKLWQYCNVLRDDGLSYPDYVEQLTYLLFLKMADEQGDGIVPKAFAWSSFAEKDAKALHHHYTKVLQQLSRKDGMLGLIFSEARNKIRDPAKLRTLVADLIGQSDWTGMSEDVKGDAYEGLLEKNAQDTKSGAGQYFTPRPIIDAVVACVRPAPGEVVCDPACGTAGFLLAAHDYIRKTHPTLKPAQRRHLRNDAIRGVELVREVARLATMNLLLHGVGDATGDSPLPIACEDSLTRPHPQKVDVVLTNPPFGVKGTFVSTIGNGTKEKDAGLVRTDFWVTTGNKQLNFLQHVHTMLKPGGRAAVVVPDNVLFEGGVAEELRRKLLTTCDVHTLLRLPTGIFYAQGVKANVLFFDLPGRAKQDAAARRLWVYDLRSGNRFSLKSKQIGGEDLDAFVACYCPGNRDTRRVEEATAGSVERWRAFEVATLLKRPGCSLDLAWSPESMIPEAPAGERLRSIAARVAGDLRAALQHIEAAMHGLPEASDK
jgi:type I restriction enzyme M protein